MKLHLTPTGQTQLVTAIEKDHIRVNHQIYQGALLIFPDRIEENWTAHDFDHLDESDFALLSALGCPIVLLGTGNKQRFPSPRLLAPVMAAGVGLEVMDIAAACRTYNILASEGRAVVAALLP